MPAWPRVWGSRPVLRDLQQRFAAAVLSGAPGALAALEGDLAGGRIPAAARLAVHRNTVQGALAQVLEAAFPVTAALAGLESFRHAAGLFLRAAPPREARLLTYGAGFPDWLAGFRPAAGRPWLSAMARLEWARNEALFAADAEPLDPALLTRVAPGKVGALRFAAHPSARLLRLDFALDGLWRRMQGAAPPQPPPAEPQVLLVLRPRLAVEQWVLSPGDGLLTERLLAGGRLDEAAEAALLLEPALDLEATLAGHLRRGSFAGCRPDESDGDCAAEAKGRGE